MNQDAKFWVAMAVFQVFFGLAVFAVTRAHYMQRASPVDVQGSEITQPVAIPGPGGITEMARSRLSHSGEAATQDPNDLWRQASQAFSNQQYQQAADIYQRLLTLRPNDVDILNELGLTLHYLGRSSEALQYLRQGVALDPNHQRIRLTLGYVDTQVGNVKEAREALTAATKLGTDGTIRQSALEMLKKLPQ
jgi:Flp pilus assembly protein TadD